MNLYKYNYSWHTESGKEISQFYGDHIISLLYDNFWNVFIGCWWLIPHQCSDLGM